MSEPENQGVCELCMEAVLKDQPHIRIGADAAIWHGESRFTSLVQNRVMIMAVFHRECVEETMENDACDDVAYVWEARSLVAGDHVCHECAANGEHPAPVQRERRFTVLQGGVA